MKRKPGFGFVQVPSALGFPEADFNLGDLLGGNPAGTKKLALVNLLYTWTKKGANNKATCLQL